jgi:hypothetical protein
MLDCPASGQSSTRLEKTYYSGTVPDSNDQVKYFFVCYQTEMMDAGMPMPALVF